MGGNFRSYGNMSPVAEFNFYVDPEAANYVIKKAPKKLRLSLSMSQENLS